MSSHIGSSARAQRTVVAALLATTAAVVPASYAQVLMTDGQPPSVTVRYSDLNLATKEGSHALYERLVTAAEQVCPARGSMMEVRENRDRERCMSSAVEHAVKKIKNPQFAEVAASRMR
jgi:UrcA family protein